VHPCTGTEALYGRTAQRRSRGIALLFLDHGTRRGEGSASRPGRSLPPGKTRYPLYRRLGGPKEQVRKTSPPPEFDPWTVHPVASHYTDYTTRPTSSSIVHLYCAPSLGTVRISHTHTHTHTHRLASERLSMHHTLRTKA